MSSDLVRVRHKRLEFNTGRANAATKGFTVLDEPTHKPDGSPRPVTRLHGRPVKPKVSVAEAAARKKSDSESQPVASDVTAVDETASNPAAGQLRPDTKEIDPV